MYAEYNKKMDDEGIPDEDRPLLSMPPMDDEETEEKISSKDDMDEGEGSRDARIERLKKFYEE